MNNNVDLEKMRRRLAKAIADKGLSNRRASLNAGLGQSYAGGILKEGKDPQVTFLARLCDTLDVSLSWVLYGVDISPETERLIAIIQNNPDKRDSILALLKDL